MKKRLLASLLAVAMIAGTLIGCGGTSSNDSSAAEKPEDAAKTEQSAGAADGEKIVLKLWHIENDAKRQEVVNRCIERFEAKYPNVTVEAVPMENDPYKTKLTTAMAAGEEPDIFISWGGGWLQSFVEEGKVLDIDEQVRELANDYHESALSLFEINDKYYAVPFRAGAAPVYYNKQIYKQYGLEVPTTIEELEANCKVLKENNVIPFALGNSSQWPGALTFIWLSLREGGAQTFLDAYHRTGKATFEDESFIKAGQRIQDWIKAGYYPEGANGINYDTGGSRMLFYSGQAAHIVQTNSFVANCKSEQPDFYDSNLGIFNYPVIEGGEGKADEILGGGNGYSIAASTKHPEEAMELVKCLSDKEYAQDMSDTAGILTGVKGVEIKDEKLQQMEDLLVNASYMQNFYDQFLPTEMGNLHKQTTYDLFGLTITPEQAAADMEAQAVKGLDK